MFTRENPWWLKNYEKEY